MKKKILVVTGARAEYGLLRPTMDAIRKHPKLALKLLVTGMHTLKTYGATKDEIARDGYAIDSIVPIQEGSDMLQSLAQEIEGMRAYCVHTRPDCILVLGDRDESFAAAIVAAHLNIPLAHIHGGDTTGPGVDEAIRNSITKLAHIHFPATKRSAARIRALGEDASRIFTVGAPALDTRAETLLSRANISRELRLEKDRAWITILMHPTAFDETPIREQINSALRAAKTYREHEKIVLYPNSDTGSDVFISAIKGQKSRRFHAFPSLPRSLFMAAVKESDALVGNSSAGIIETGSLGTPTVDIGNRQKGRERGKGVIHVPYDAERIAHAISQAISLKKKQQARPFLSPYGAGNSGVQIAQHLAHALSNPYLLDKRRPPLSNQDLGTGVSI